MPLQGSINDTRGYSLVELLIAMAILAILASISIPAYNSYIREGHYATLLSNLNSMRTVIEDHRLDRGTYVPAGHSVGDQLGNADIMDTSKFGWDPSTDTGVYSYTVAVVSTTNYHLWGQLNTNVWVRCENRYANCCASDATGATVPSANCP